MGALSRSFPLAKGRSSQCCRRKSPWSSTQASSPPTAVECLMADRVFAPNTTDAKGRDPLQTDRAHAAGSNAPCVRPSTRLSDQLRPNGRLAGTPVAAQLLPARLELRSQTL